MNTFLHFRIIAKFSDVESNVEIVKAGSFMLLCPGTAVIL